MLAAVAAVDKRHSELRVEQFGDASADKAISKAFEDDFKKAEVTSLPITLIILVVAFGALVAAGIPLLLAVTAVAATIGLIGPISQIAPVDESITSVVLLIGLAVGVDYSLFYLRREREERAAGRSERGGAGGRRRDLRPRGADLRPHGDDRDGRDVPRRRGRSSTSFAIGTILVVAVAVIGSLTVLPAVLSKLGDRVEKGRVPLIGRRKRAGGESRVWGAVIDRVLRRPLVSRWSSRAACCWRWRSRCSG